MNNITPGTRVVVNKPVEGQAWNDTQRERVGQTGKVLRASWDFVWVRFPDGAEMDFHASKLTALPRKRARLAAVEAALAEMKVRVDALTTPCCTEPQPAHDGPPVAGEGTYWRAGISLFRVKDGAVEWLNAAVPGNVWTACPQYTPADLLDTARFEPYSPKAGEWIEGIGVLSAKGKVQAQKVEAGRVWARWNGDDMDSTFVYLADIGDSWLPCAPARETVAAVEYECGGLYRGDGVGYAITHHPDGSMTIKARNGFALDLAFRAMGMTPEARDAS